METDFVKYGAIALAGYVVGLAFKLLERIMGKIHYTQDAREFLSDHAEKLENINSTMEKQAELMKDLRDYAKQNAENAVRMSMLLDQMYRRDS